MSSPLSGAGAGLGRRLDRLGEGPFAALMAAPGLLLILLIVAPPILAVIAFSFFRIELSSPGTEPFIALRNFVVRLPADAELFGTIPVTAIFAGLVTLISVPVALGAALFVHGRRKWAGLFALLLILPWAVAPIADGILWRLLLDPSYGIIGKLLRYVHLPPIRVGTPEGSFVALLLAATWRAVPLLGVLFLGALRQVPPDLLRAARMDGASAWQAFRRVTLPIIAPTVIAATLIELILSLQVFDIQFALTANSPPKGTELIGTHIFHSIMETVSLGYGATQTLLLALLIGVGIWLLWTLVVRNRGTDATTVDDDPTEARRRPIPARPANVVPQRWEPEARPRRFGSVRSSMARLGTTLGAILLILWVVTPLLWLAVASIQADVRLDDDPPKLGLPLEFGAYQAFIRSSIWQGAAAVSITVATGATLIALTIAAMAAYPLARYRLRGGRALLMVLLASQLMPPIALAIPMLYVFIRLDLRNTVPGLILVNVAFWTPVFVWLLRAAFLAVPRTLEQAARIDGSSRLGAIFRIVVPAAGPAIAAATAIVFIGIWNDFVFIATLGGRDTRTLASFLGESAQPSFHNLATKLVLTIAPCIVVLVVLGRRILRLV